jgi:hypothetical protein
MAVMARLHEADELQREWRRGLDEIPPTGPSRDWFINSQAYADYFAGRWDAALDGIRTFLDGLPAADTHVLEADLRPMRSVIELARDRLPEAAADAERAVAVGSGIGDPASVARSLCARALVRLACGRDDDALTDFEQLISLRNELAVGVAEFMPDFAWLALDLGRTDDASNVLDASAMPRWTRVAVAVLEGDAGAAADLLAEIGHRPAEAYARLRAGGGHLERALEFYRSVGATRYIAEAEALLSRSI